MIILYLGGDKCEGDIKKDEIITEDAFNELTGKNLKERGFVLYTIVYNFIDSNIELTAVERGHWKYFEEWIFLSGESGDTPKGGKKIYYNAQSQSENENEKKVNEDYNGMQIRKS